MNKSELSKRMAEMTGMTQRASMTAVDSFCDIVAKELAYGGQVRLMGFGSFFVCKAKERRARNPHTKEVILIPARNIIRFSPGKEIKRRIQ